MNPTVNPTDETYAELQEAYDHFNKELFNLDLPPCLLTLQREKQTQGYFSVDRFVRVTGEQVHEIAMNPEYFAIHSVEEILSTLVHELVHCYQAKVGTPGRGRYHNSEWGSMMEQIGLMPSSTGAPGGKRTGDRMSDYIIEGGRFAVACEKLVTREFRISWMDRFPAPKSLRRLKEKARQQQEAETAREAQREQDHGLPVEGEQLEGEGGLALCEESPFDETAEKAVPEGKPREDYLGQLERIRDLGVAVGDSHTTENRSKRNTYACPRCRIRVWGKPKLNLLCGNCRVPLQDTTAGIGHDNFIEFLGEEFDTLETVDAE